MSPVDELRAPASTVVHFLLESLVSGAGLPRARADERDEGKLDESGGPELGPPYVEVLSTFGFRAVIFAEPGRDRGCVARRAPVRGVRTVVVADSGEVSAAADDGRDHGRGRIG